MTLVQKRLTLSENGEILHAQFKSAGGRQTPPPTKKERKKKMPDSKLKFGLGRVEYIARKENIARCLQFSTIIYIRVVKTRDCINREYIYSAVVYQKYLTRLRKLIIFEPWRENYHFS